MKLIFCALCFFMGATNCIHEPENCPCKDENQIAKPFNNNQGIK